MGALVSRALRPVKAFNIENRAHRVISKEKPDPAPRYPSTAEELQRVEEIIPDIKDKLERKDSGLDERLKNVYVTSTGEPEDDITRLKKEQNPDRPLPKEKRAVGEFDYGFKEPEKVPYGRTTLRLALEYISSHQLNPEEATAAKIAYEYKMKESDVESILKYFRTYEVYVPETKTSKATFAGPATMRKKLFEQTVGKIAAKESDAKDPKDEKQNLDSQKVKSTS